MSQLFDVDVSPLGTEEHIEGAKPSADRARTIRRNALLERGIHPSGNGAVDREHSCGTCAHCTTERHGGGTRIWHKCELRPRTFGPGTDIRLSWPACPFWTEVAT